MIAARSTRRRLARGIELGLLAGGAGLAVAAELRNRRALAEDHIYQSALRAPLRGTPLRAVSADGTELHAEVFGPADAELTFVMFPGWTEDLHIFDLLTRGLLDRGYRVVGCDLRGQGAGGPPVDGDHRIERYGEDVDALLAAAASAASAGGSGGSGGSVIAVGHSMGAMSIAAWAGLESVDVASRVRGVVLMNTGMSELVLGSRLLPERLPAAVRAAVGVRVVLGGSSRYLPVSTPISRALLRYVAYGPSATAGQVAFYEPMLWACPPHVRAAAGMTLSTLDLRTALARLAVPTLVIAGDVDRLTPASHAREIAERLPDLAELLVLEQTGHMAPLERPAEIIAGLERLVERVGLGPAVASAP